mmetsp:Transcript_11304/g.28116  ORF Transcript_11304/g.28116 Transcript_11304/m.28116 type:complete len:394 (+) Transcript_11304:637-1818(+)
MRTGVTQPQVVLLGQSLLGRGLPDRPAGCLTETDFGVLGGEYGSVWSLRRLDQGAVRCLAAARQLRQEGRAGHAAGDVGGGPRLSLGDFGQHFRSRAAWGHHPLQREAPLPLPLQPRAQRNCFGPLQAQRVVAGRAIQRHLQHGAPGQEPGCGAARARVALGHHPGHVRLLRRCRLLAGLSLGAVVHGGCRSDGGARADSGLGPPRGPLEPEPGRTAEPRRRLCLPQHLANAGLLGSRDRRLRRCGARHRRRGAAPLELERHAVDVRAAVAGAWRAPEIRAVAGLVLVWGAGECLHHPGGGPDCRLAEGRQPLRQPLNQRRRLRGPRFGRRRRERRRRDLRRKRLARPGSARAWCWSAAGPLPAAGLVLLVPQTRPQQPLSGGGARHRRGGEA